MHLFVAGFIFFSASFIMNAQISQNLLGEWTFDAPEAPEGATFGTAILKADTVIMAFEGGLQFPSDWVKAQNDSITYETTFDDVKVRFALKVVDEQSMSGNAIAPEGLIPITFRRKKV